MRGRLLLGLFVLGLVGVSVAAAGLNRSWSVHANGSQEVPARDTQGQAQAIFHLSKDGSSLDYKLIASNIENVFMAHIHCGAPTVNGPITVWLYPSPAPPPMAGPPGAGRHDGVLVTGTFTDANVIDLAPNPANCTGGISDIGDVIELLQNGGAYVNVHTNLDGPPFTNQPGDIPGGEIRGNTP